MRKSDAHYQVGYRSLFKLFVGIIEVHKQQCVSHK